MEDIDLTEKFKEKMKSRPRVRGRYHSSEMFFILNGSTTPEQFLEPKERTVKELMTMYNGTGVHNQIQDIIGREYSEQKKEIVYKGIVLVGSADYLPPGRPDDVWELKSSERKMTEAKPWHEHQVKLYCTIFNKRKGFIYQPVSNEDGIYLKCLGEVDRDDIWFEQQMEALYQFHLRVEALLKSRGQ